MSSPGPTLDYSAAVAGAPTPTRVVLLAALSALALLIWSGWNVDQGNTEMFRGGIPYPGLIWIWIAGTAVFACLSALAWRLMRANAVVTASRRTVVFILVVATAVRIALLVGWIPTLSSDMFRYRFEGHMILEGHQPYSCQPSDVNLDHGAWFDMSYIKPSPRPYDLLDRMSNNTFLPAVYFPLPELVFGIGAALENAMMGPAPYRPHDVPRAGPSPAAQAQFVELAGNSRMLSYRAVHTAADVGAVVLLMVALVATGRSVWWVVLYAWNPLPLIEIAGNGHFESVGIFIFAGLMLATFRKRWMWAAVWLGLALLVKPVALFLVLPLAAAVIHARRTRAAGGPFRIQNAEFRSIVAMLAKMAGIVVLIVVAGFAPFHAGLADLSRTLGEVGRFYEFNGFAFDVLRATFFGQTGPIRPILTLLNAGLQVLIFILALRRGWSFPRTAGYALLICLMTSPMVYPWYGLWTLAAAVLAWNRAAWLLALALPWSYAVLIVFHASGNWQIPFWVLLLEWAPVAALVVWQLRAERPALG